MDTLLHGAIQASSHNTDVSWNCAECPKDRTIFCSDVDMDITASNTITIHGLLDEKIKKIDTSQFLASLKSQNLDEEVKKNTFELSIGAEKHFDFTFKRDSSMDHKIKFNYLASLGNEKSKAANYLEGAEKQINFPFSQTHFHTWDNTENVTQMFREQDDGLDLTKCRTTNIDSYFPKINREITNHFTFTADKGNIQPKLLTLSEFSHLKSSGLNSNLNKPALNDQTVFIDDRDITCDQLTSLKDITFHTSALDNMAANTICHVVDTTRKVSKQQLLNETVHQECDMKITNINASPLVATGKSESWNKVLSLESLKDKTMYLGDTDDMDITGAHIAIEDKVIEMDDHLKSMSQNATDSSATGHLDGKPVSRTNSVQALDTVFIDCENSGYELQLPIAKSAVLSTTRNHYVVNTEMDKGKGTVFDKEINHLEKTTPVTVELQDKTLFFYEQNHMDLTRSHTATIESKTLKGIKNKNFIEFQNSQKLTNRGTVLDVTNAINMADITSINKVCTNDEEIDVTKSKAVFIDHISDNLHKDVHVSDFLPKRKSAFLPKSSVSSDKTILQVCNMEETNTCIQLTKSLINKSDSDKTLYNQGDMEITKSHTFAIEKSLESALIDNPVSICSLVSRTGASCDQVSTDLWDRMGRARPQDASNDRAPAESKHTSVSKNISCKKFSMLADPKHKAMPFSVTTQENKLELQGSCILAQKSQVLLGSDETMFPNEETMDITKAHTAAVEVCFLEDKSHIPRTGTDVIKGFNTEVADAVEVSGKIIEKEQKCDLNEPIERLERFRRKNYATSLSLSVKSGIILENLGNYELAQMPTIPIDVSLLKTNTDSCGNAETGVTIDNESDNTIAFDHNSKEIANTSSRNGISPNTDTDWNPIFPDNSGVCSDCKVESLEEHSIPDDKMGDEHGLKSQFLKVKNDCLKISKVTPVYTSLNCETSCLTSDSIDCKGLKEQNACALPVETLICVNQKDSDMTLEKQTKLATLKGKRVSLYVPESDIGVKDVIFLDQVTEPSVSREGKYDEVEQQDRVVHVTDDISDFKFDVINKVSIRGMMQDTENLEGSSMHKDSNVILNTVAGFPKDLSSHFDCNLIVAELSQKRNERRSIADLQLKIKSLTQKSKTSLSHTALVSNLIEQLPNTVTAQEKELINEKNKTIKENYLANRLAIKMLQPKLPNKRALSTSNIPEPVLSPVSEAAPQNALCPKAHLKTFMIIVDGQHINEEMLPACPDDQDSQSILHYEVPEGAWEQLCQEETLQQNSGKSTTQIVGQKRVRDTEDDFESQREKKARWKEDILEKDDAQNSMAFKGADKSYRNDCSTHESKTMEQTYYSSSSQDSRGDGMSVEWSSQQYCQIDSQLPWEIGCEQSLWQKFQDGTILVQEFFVLLRIRILIQKPRYSELPSQRGMNEHLTASEIVLEQYVYQCKLQVYEEECYTLYKAIEELKVSTELQRKPLVQINSVLWEAMRLCSENELMYFGVTLKNMKSLYSKKSKRMAHEEKVFTYSKLLGVAQTQWENLQARLRETEKLLREIEGSISSIEIETARLNEECNNEKLSVKVHGCIPIQAERDCLKTQEQLFVRENLELEEKKQRLLGQLDCLQEEAGVIDKCLQEPSFTEWELVKWTDKAAAFIFLYGSLELSITFGDYIDGENFYNRPCRKISGVTVESQLIGE
ncbi:Cancer susceptibility candidate 5, partial [Pristimantis euphronides]